MRKYVCEFCDYETSNITGLSHHKNTKRHLKNTSMTHINKNNDNEQIFFLKEKLEFKDILIKEKKEKYVLQKKNEFCKELTTYLNNSFNLSCSESVVFPILYAKRQNFLKLL